MTKPITYTPAEVSKLIGLDRATIRRYAEFFDIDAPRETTEKGKGHRRYTERNIEELKKINDLIHVQGLTWKLTKDVLDGDKRLLPVSEIPSEEELNLLTFKKRLDAQEKVIGEMYKLLNDVNLKLEFEQSERKKVEEEKEQLALQLQEKAEEVQEEVQKEGRLKKFFSGFFG